MAKRNFWSGMLVMVLVFGMAVVGCDNNGLTNGENNHTRNFTGTNWSTGPEILSFTSDNTWTLINSRGTVSSGSYEVNGSVANLTATSGASGSGTAAISGDSVNLEMTFRSSGVEVHHSSILGRIQNSDSYAILFVTFVNRTDRGNSNFLIESGSDINRLVVRRGDDIMFDRSISIPIHRSYSFTLAIPLRKTFFCPFLIQGCDSRLTLKRQFGQVLPRQMQEVTVLALIFAHFYLLGLIVLLLYIISRSPCTLTI